MPFGFISPNVFREVVKGFSKQVSELQQNKIDEDKPRKARFLRSMGRIEKLRDELMLSNNEKLLTLLEQLTKAMAREFTKLKK